MDTTRLVRMSCPEFSFSAGMSWAKKRKAPLNCAFLPLSDRNPLLLEGTRTAVQAASRVKKKLSLPYTMGRRKGLESAPEMVRRASSRLMLEMARWRLRAARTAVWTFSRKPVAGMLLSSFQCSSSSCGATVR